MVQLDKDPHDLPAFLSDQVTPGARDFFDQSMLTQLPERTAGLGTALFCVFHVREDGFSDIPVPEAAYQVPAVTDSFHDTHHVGGPYIKTRDAPAFDGLS